MSDIPQGLVSFDVDQAAVTMNVDADVYPLQALYGAAFIFIDRCYVFIDKPQDKQFRVTLTARGSVEDEGALRKLVGEFANELLTCAWRHQITADNRMLIEAVTMQAIGGAAGSPSLDDLANFDFSDDAFEDPLGIAQSWEEKHGNPKNKDGADDTAGAAEEKSK